MFYNLRNVRKIFKRLRKIHKLCTFIQKHSEACGMFYNLGKVRKKYLGYSGRSKSIQNHSEACWIVGSLKKYLGYSGRWISFVPSFKNILNLLECFASYEKLEKIFRRLRKVHKILTFIQNHSESFGMIYKVWNCNRNI